MHSGVYRVVESSESIINSSSSKTEKENINKIYLWMDYIIGVFCPPAAVIWALILYAA